MLALADVLLRRPSRRVCGVSLRAVGHDLGVAGAGRSGRRRVSRIGLGGPVSAGSSRVTRIGLRGPRHTAGIRGQAGTTGIGTRHSHRVPTWVTGLRVCGRQGRDPGQASGRKGQARCTFDHHDCSPRCVSIKPRTNKTVFPMRPGPVEKVKARAQNAGSGRPRRRQAASKVLSKRQAIVIGPTPPGTGVIAPATALTDGKIDVADNPVASFGIRRRADTDVDDRGSRLHPVGR